MFNTLEYPICMLIKFVLCFAFFFIFVMLFSATPHDSSNLSNASISRNDFWLQTMFHIISSFTYSKLLLYDSDSRDYFKQWVHPLTHCYTSVMTLWLDFFQCNEYPLLLMTLTLEVICDSRHCFQCIEYLHLLTAISQPWFCGSYSRSDFQL